MTKQNAPQERRDDVLVGVLNALAAAARTTQIKTFHGLVPAVVELRRVIDQLDDLAGLDAYRAKRRSAVTSQLSAARNHIAECVQAIEARASGAGYPLDAAIADYEASGAGLTTLATMRAALAESTQRDWDVLAAALTEEPGDAAA